MNYDDEYDDEELIYIHDPEWDNAVKKIKDHKDGIMVIINDISYLGNILYLRVTSNDVDIHTKRLYLTAKYKGEYGTFKYKNEIEYKVTSIQDIIARGAELRGITLFGWSPFYFRAYINSTSSFDHILDSLSIEKHLYNYLYEGVVYLINGTGNLSDRLVGTIYEDDTKLILHLTYTYVFRLTALGFLDLELMPYYKRLSFNHINNVINYYDDIIVEDAHDAYEFYPELFSKLAHYKSIILVTNSIGYEKCQLFKEIKIDSLVNV